MKPRSAVAIILIATALATMVWSIVLKLHVAGTGLLILWFAWEERHERR